MSGSTASIETQHKSDVDLFHLLARLWQAIERDTKIIFAICFAAAFLAYGFIFTNLTINHDGFGFITVAGSNARLTGRWFTDIVYGLVFRNYELIWLHGIIAAALFVATGLSICRCLSLDRFSDRLVLVLLYTLFPYMCSYYGYAFHVPIYALASLLAVLPIELARLRRPVMALFGAILLMLSLASYQAFISTTVTTVMLAGAIGFARIKERKELRSVLIVSCWQLGTILLGVGFYWLSIKLCTAVAGIHLNTYQGADSMSNLDWTSIAKGATDVLRETGRFVGIPAASPYPETPYFTITDKLLSVLLYFVAAVGLWTVTRLRIAGVLSIVAFAIALFAPRTLQFVHANANYHELTLIGYAVYIAAAGTFALNARLRGARICGQVIVLLLIGRFIHSDNVGATALAFDYQAIMHWGNRILTRIEENPRYAEMPRGSTKRVIFVGDLYRVSDWFYRGHPFVTAVGIADGVPNIIFDSVLRLLRVNATSWGVSTDDHRKALTYAAEHHSWPHPDSVTILDDGTIVVVLDKSGLVQSGSSP
jgi:hypothetical protein